MITDTHETRQNPTTASQPGGRANPRFPTTPSAGGTAVGPPSGPAPRTTPPVAALAAVFAAALALAAIPAMAATDTRADAGPTPPRAASTPTTPNPATPTPADSPPAAPTPAASNPATPNQEPEEAGPPNGEDGNEPRPASEAEGADAGGATAPAARFEQRLTVTATAPELAAGLSLPGSDLETGASHDAVEHLRRHPGLDAARRGAVNLDPQVRGLGETQLATLVDGTRTFAAGPARMDSGLSHVNPHAVGSVEVVKGPYALTWGAGALSAIRFETRRPPFSAAGFRWTGRTGAAYGDNGSRRDLHASVAGGGERFRLQVDGGLRSGDDYESGSGTAVPGAYDSTEGRLQIGFRATDGLLLELDGAYQDQEDLDYPGRLLDATYFKTRSYAGRVAWTPAGDGVDAVSGLLYANRKDHRMNNDGKPTALPMPGRVPPFGLAVDLPTESNTAGGRLAVDGRRGDVTWSAGGDAYRLEQNARRTISRRDDGRALFADVLFADVVWPDVLLEDGGLFVQGRRNAERLTVAGALRYDRWSAEARRPVTDFFLAAAGAAAPRDEDLWSAALSGRLAPGPAHRPSGHALSFGIGRAVRPPTALELYADRFPSTRFQVAAEFVGDPRLEPETSLQVDLGWSYRGPALGISLDAFARRLDDHVTVQPDPDLARRLPLSPPVVYRYVNGSRADFVGAEALLEARPGRHWQVRANASWVRATDRELDEPVFGVAPVRGDLALRWQPSPAAAPAWLAGSWVDLAVHHAEPQDRVAGSRLERPTPGWTTLDLAAGRRFGDRWELVVGMDNLLDEAYAEHLNALNPFTGERIGEPGRSAFARLGVDF